MNKKYFLNDRVYKFRCSNNHETVMESWHYFSEGDNYANN